MARLGRIAAALLAAGGVAGYVAAGRDDGAGRGAPVVADAERRGPKSRRRVNESPTGPDGGPAFIPG